MNRSVLSALAISIFLLCGVPARATTWFEVTKECPIGGKKFKSQEMGSNSYFGQRPDGRPYSPSPIPPIDECPDNGFVIFDETFTKEELSQLTSLVASSEYKELQASETRHYRAWWLMKKIGRDPYQLAIRLLFASWETDQNSDRKARYQSAFASQALALEFSEERRENWFWLRMRAANALRETGSFEDSEAVISSAMVAERMPRETDQQEGANWLAQGLRALNADRNAHPEPANLIPPRMALERCQIKDISAAETKACDSQAVKDEAEEQRKWRETAAEDASPSAAADAATAAAEAAEDAAKAAAEANRKSKRKRD